MRLVFGNGRWLFLRSVGNVDRFVAEPFLLQTLVCVFMKKNATITQKKRNSFSNQSHKKENVSCRTETVNWSHARKVYMEPSWYLELLTLESYIGSSNKMRIKNKNIVFPFSYNNLWLEGTAISHRSSNFLELNEMIRRVEKMQRRGQINSKWRRLCVSVSTALASSSFWIWRQCPFQRPADLVV